MNTERIIFFDGVCNLCNGAVNFVIDRDKKGRFKLAALQSEEAKPFLKGAGLDKDELSTILLYEDGKMYKKSTAALRIARNLDGLWPLLYVFMIVPRFIRDGVYSWIAKNRYKWFGKKDSCRMPTPDLKARFLSTDS
jgi:predicted DCC family thiol-disulfide oxidoreductase YuxK